MLSPLRGYARVKRFPLISERLGYVQSESTAPVVQAIREIGRMLVRLRRSLEARIG